MGLPPGDAGYPAVVLAPAPGPGAAAAARSKLFRAFSRGVSSDGPAGLGLGLALSQSLARAMGGDLEHRAGPARGATFVLRLAKP
jgi:signal transduction histidine kinase